MSILAPKLVSTNISNLKELNNTVEKFNPNFESEERKIINNKLMKLFIIAKMKLFCRKYVKYFEKKIK